MVRWFTLCLLLAPLCATARPPVAPPQRPPPVTALMTPPAQCEAAITAAEMDRKLPARVLSAISLRESGRYDPAAGRVRPWPWSINYEGVGQVFATKADAIAAVQAIQMAGGQSIDVGCMQVNLMFHPNAFASLEDAFDPVANANYAARFLSSLFASTGDWGIAIGAYHSRTPGKGEAYRDMVVATWGPTDPAVLSKLTMNPLPVVNIPYASLSVGGVSLIRPMVIPIGPNMAYRSFPVVAASLPSPAYRSFRPVSATYADFAPKIAKKPGKPLMGLAMSGRPVSGRPLDLRLDPALGSVNRGLVTPRAVIDRTDTRPERKKTAQSG